MAAHSVIFPDRMSISHANGTLSRRRLAQLSLLALGVVYGDIGTSPLYAFRECFGPEHRLDPIPDNVYGVLSLIVWSLIMIVGVKYIGFIMRADNKGEGGILALLALLLRKRKGVPWRSTAIALGLIGAALLFGDGVITPAISVLSAVEGLEIISPTLSRIVIPATLVILFGLFVLQKRGTASVGMLFGPVMTLWFVTIGALGAAQVVQAPRILLALNPWFGLSFLITHGWTAFVLLGAVVLAVTGAEALYADLGHFGKRPIRLAWFALVLPALVLNYLGQGALLLENAAAKESPFFLLAPSFMLYPLVILATLATVIASQALISGAFSLAQQSVQLGYMPRVTIVHTSSLEAGQIYIPEINRMLMIGCLLVVLGFQTSANLSAAYGIAVTGTMAITTVLFALLARTRWHWKWWLVGLFTFVFLTIDLAFFSANALKIMHGGWVPAVIAVWIFIAMTTWHRGRAITAALLREGRLPLDMLLASIQSHKVARVPGTAVFMSPESDGTPVVLLHHLKHNKVLHETVILLTVKAVDVPGVNEAERITITPLEQGFIRVVAKFGFMETPNVQHVIDYCVAHGIRAARGETTYYLGRERLLISGSSALANWRKRIYIFMAHNARPATEFFNLPPDRVVELGAQLTI
jgi:KUP system potassium uptake protein